MKGRILTVLLLITFLAGAGCSLLNAILPFGLSLSVSQGSYAGAVQISWSTNHGEDINAAAYRIYRKGPDDSFFLLYTTLSGSASSFLDASVQPGRIYTYYVEAKTVDGSGYISYNSTSWGSGYAMLTQSLKIYSTEQQAGQMLTTSTANDYSDICWMSFIAQKNWNYMFKSDSLSPSLNLSIFSSGNIEYPLAVSSTGALYWNAPASGTYYLKITTVSALDEGTPFLFKSWHTYP